MQEKHLLTLPSARQPAGDPDARVHARQLCGRRLQFGPGAGTAARRFLLGHPDPRHWPKERVESKLREYNFYKLKLLTIHEAMPGHYVQMEIANDVQPARAACCVRSSATARTSKAGASTPPR